MAKFNSIDLRLSFIPYENFIPESHGKKTSTEAVFTAEAGFFACLALAPMKGLRN
ncbi:hypothetical protein SAMN05421677_106186 [Halobacillus aidingensis]|uniref:Uncharacterized protein n=1 Tax=Halobacillus aidingensis TaxID=240303 RepID=A0A1H0L3A2_HALAD|nr:hypothetical protein SAMN05421677_106186 [Halobacillus aidingensis]